jgi:hypothetical protein
MTRERILYIIFVILANVHIQAEIEHLLAAELLVIYPGEGIGEIKLGDSVRRVVELWKEKSDEIKKVEFTLDKNKKVTEFLLFYKRRGIIFVCEPDQKIKRIIIKNPSFPVKENGLHIGSSTSEIERAYQGTKSEKNSKKESEKIKALLYGGDNELSAKRVQRQHRSPQYSFSPYSGHGIVFALDDDKKEVIAITIIRPEKELSKVQGIMGTGIFWEELLYWNPTLQP